MNRILVVDDNLASLSQISTLLESNYEVLLAKSGKVALQICRMEHPDLILMDVEMPGMDGFETIAALRADIALSGIPVIFLTGNRDGETEVKCLEAGGRDFIAKPVRRDILCHRINLHLRFSEYQLQLEDMVKHLSNSLSISLAEMIEFRDENTGGHVVRTSRYAQMLGTRLLDKNSFGDRLNEETLDMIVRAVPLHDIGKIAISDRVLLKPGKLDDAEFDIMKTHAAIGANILRDMYVRTPTQRYLKYAETIAASHHERFDGKGYPAHLSGEDIPVAGRIMAVADVYDALVDNRVYRRGMPHTQACEIIVSGRGTQFDPCVVDAFCALADSFLEYSAL